MGTFTRTAAGVAVGFGLGALVVVAPGIGLAGKKAPPEAPTAAVVNPTEPPPIEVPGAAVSQLVPASSFAPLVDAVRPAVVAIGVDEQRKGGSDLNLENVPPMFRPFLGEVPNQKIHGEGSGFVISSDGYVLTNNHVVENADKITARFADGREVRATVVGTDPATDIALIKLDGHETWPHVDLGSSKDLRVGDWVVAIGNPLGLGITVTAGIVSGTGRVLGHDAYDDFIQTDAAINQGNSGGPLFDTQGRVVGMNTAIIQGANTVGFAVPSDLIDDVLHDLRTDGKVSRGYLGVELQNMDVTLAKAMGAGEARGALVASVSAGTPAAKAGLQDGDVITSFAGTPVTDSSTLVRAVARHDPGEKVDLQVLRQGRTQTVKLTLAERPRDPNDPSGGSSEPEEPSSSSGSKRLGIGLAPLPRDAQRQLGASSGVVVNQVDPSGPAADKLAAGDVIQQVDGTPVSSPDEVKAAIQKGGDTVVLKVVRQGDSRYVAITR